MSTAFLSDFHLLKMATNAALKVTSKVTLKKVTEKSQKVSSYRTSNQ